MNFKEVLKDAIRTNTKLIVTGHSGYGKSEMIKEVADELNLELIDFRLSEILPEDLVGIPKLMEDYYEYMPPKWVRDVLNNPNKKYLLFLDEITQGTPEVLNICYKIFDKVTKVGNYELPNVSVVGATNYSHESDYINELPTPLKNRACNIILDENANIYAKYLMDKYDFNKSENKNAIKILFNDIINDTNPRALEKAITLVNENANEQLAIAYINQDSYLRLKSLIQNKPVDINDLSNLEKAKNDLQKGYILLGKRTKKAYNIEFLEQLKLLYHLTDEEFSILEQDFANLEQPLLTTYSKDTTNAIMAYLTRYDTVSNQEIEWLIDKNILDVEKYMHYSIPRIKNAIPQVKAISNYTGISVERLLKFAPTWYKYADEDFLNEFSQYR